MILAGTLRPLPDIRAPQGWTASTETGTELINDSDTFCTTTGHSWRWKSSCLLMPGSNGFFFFEQSEWREHTCLKDIQKILKREKVGWSSLLQKVFKRLFTGMCLRHMNWQSHTDQINQIISQIEADPWVRIRFAFHLMALNYMKN